MADYTEYHGEAIKRFFKPPTNADRIRAMSDEELAMIIMCPTDGKCPTLYPSCYECALNWLQSPAGEVGDGD